VAERPVVLPPEKRTGAMMDIESYRRAAEHCADKAGVAESKEMRQAWLAIEQSYRRLLDREERIEQEARSM